jgi:sporulation and spore germination protein
VTAPVVVPYPMKTRPTLNAAPALLALLLTACTTGLEEPVATPSPNPSAAPSPVPSPDEAVSLTVFFLITDETETTVLLPVERSVSRTEDPAAAAIRQLLAGPTPEERSGSYPGRAANLARLSTSVPDGTNLLHVAIDNGVATVNLSSEFGMADDLPGLVYRQGQVVYTLTALPNVQRVALQVDGAPTLVYEGHEGTPSAGPAVRELYFDQRRSVFVETPAWGARVEDPVNVRGTASIDAPLRIALVDGASNTILAEQSVQPTWDPCMPPDAWGPFEARLTLAATHHPADLRLRIWEPPFAIGDPTVAIDYPLN